MQNQTWPLRWPKMVPITMDLEGREAEEETGKGGSRSVVVVESWESLSWFASVTESSSGWSSLREVLRRFLMGVVVVEEEEEEVAGVRQGRSRRRASILAMGFLEEIGLGSEGYKYNTLPVDISQSGAYKKEDSAGNGHSR
ncbi:hypothetical protein V6N12_032046 [Hibiscus sabdariffa]|uniref:Uncharacterized protein n=1 Tax=Hibiscus sabdariffa TaxID=183260 RepID=A0ABR2BYX7_9ROSI